MRKPIILFKCPSCNNTKFFGIEEETENYFLYKCRECGKIIVFQKETMELC